MASSLGFKPGTCLCVSRSRFLVEDALSLVFLHSLCVLFFMHANTPVLTRAHARFKFKCDVHYSATKALMFIFKVVVPLMGVGGGGGKVTARHILVKSEEVQMCCNQGAAIKVFFPSFFSSLPFLLVLLSADDGRGSLILTVRIFPI